MANESKSDTIQQCVNGHFYDTVRNRACPFCHQQARDAHVAPPPITPVAPPTPAPPVVPVPVPPRPNLAPGTPTPPPVEPPPASRPSTLPTAPPPAPALPAVKETVAPVASQCPNGHMYDPRIAASCPYCAVTGSPRKKSRLGWFLFFFVVVALTAAGLLYWRQNPQQIGALLAGLRSRASGATPQVATFDAVPEQIEAGDSATLRWTTANATTTEIDHGVGVVTGQQIVVSPSTTTLYTLTASGQGTSASRAVLVTVREKSQNKPVIDSFTATPDTIESGQSAVLHWSVKDAISIAIDNGVGEVQGNEVTVHPEVTTSYLLTAKNSLTAVTQTLTVSVNAPPPPPKAAIENFFADPDRIQAGQGTVLHWSVKNAASTSIDNGIGPVQGDSIIVRPDSTTRYTLTAVGPANTDTSTVEVAVTLPPPRPVMPAPVPPPQSGTLRCQGVAVPPNGRVDFDELPAARLRFFIDPPGAWAALTSTLPDGSQRLTLVSRLSTIQTYCAVRWEVVH